jgi:protein-tyrosine-phosphatase
MAEAFARIHGKGRIEAHSAGSRPSGEVNPQAIESMKEIGYDLSTHRSKSVDDIPSVDFDYIITMGCGDACPNVPARHREDWDIPDPKDLGPREFTDVRDKIEMKVENLLK